MEKEKGRKNEKWVKRAEMAGRHTEVWEIVDRGERDRRRINEGIEMNKWREYFMNMLGVVEEKVVGERGKRSGRERREEEISLEEMRRLIKKLKIEKRQAWTGYRGRFGNMGGGREWRFRHGIFVTVYGKVKDNRSVRKMV